MTLPGRLRSRSGIEAWLRCGCRIYATCGRIAPPIPPGRKMDARGEGADPLFPAEAGHSASQGFYPLASEATLVESYVVASTPHGIIPQPPKLETWLLEKSASAGS